MLKISNMFSSTGKEASFCAGLLVCLLLNSIVSPAQDFPGLKNVFKGKYLIGAAVNAKQTYGLDTVAKPIVAMHFNSLTAENALKWEKIHPVAYKYEFDTAEAFISLCKNIGAAPIGHTLIWHSQTPEWVFKDTNGKPIDRDTLLQRMKDHITTVVNHFKGRVLGWDVVNEALNEDGTLRKSPWLDIIGEEYIQKAFEFAHEADPSAELYYNDYSLENISKRNGAITLITKLKKSGTVINAVGLQGHYKMDWPTVGKLDSTIKEFGKLGIKVMVTEMDIDVLPYEPGLYEAEISIKLKQDPRFDPYKNGLPDSVQNALASRYAELFRVFDENAAIFSRVTFWGITDADSWLNHWPIEGRTDYPLLFDRNGEPKPAFFGIIKQAIGRK